MSMDINNCNSKSILERIDRDETQRNKISEMYRIKHTLFDYIHHRIRSLGKSHTSQKLGWYKRRWGNEIHQFYFDRFNKVVKGDLDRIIEKLYLEYERVKSLRNKDFKKMFSHKKPKRKNRIKREMMIEKNDELISHFRGVPKEI